MDLWSLTTLGPLQPMKALRNQILFNFSTIISKLIPRLPRSPSEIMRKGNPLICLSEKLRIQNSDHLLLKGRNDSKSNYKLQRIKTFLIRNKMEFTYSKSLKPFWLGWKSHITINRHDVMPLQQIHSILIIYEQQKCKQEWDLAYFTEKS